MEETEHGLAGSEVPTWRLRDQKSPGVCATNVGLFTLKLRLDFPGAGGRSPEHVPIAVLQQHQAGPSVCVRPQSWAAVPWSSVAKAGRGAPPLLGQVRVDVDDGQDIQDAGKLPLKVHLALRDQECSPARDDAGGGSPGG